MTMVFWGASALFAAVAALLVMAFARRAQTRSGGERPELAVHRRQLAELDDLLDRGLLNPEDRDAARAEAARRLLASAGRTAPEETAGAPSSVRWVAGAAVFAGFAALGLYLALGRPGAPDAPYRVRLESLRRQDPSTLTPGEMAAVLKTIAADRPSDPKVFEFLGRAESAAGDPYAAAKAFRRAAALDPTSAADQTLLGEALLDGAAGKPSPDAEAAFRRALALDPTNAPARYSLGRLAIEQGRREEGLAQWRVLEAGLAAGDPRKAAFAAVVDRVAAGGPIEAAPSGGEAAAAAPAFIRSMVESLAAKLRAHPDDPAGWARLVRSYGVLHDKTGQAQALDGAHAAFKGDPEKAKAAEAEARSHPA